MDALTRQELSNILYKVAVPVIATYELEELEVMGIPTRYDYNTGKCSKHHAELTNVTWPLDRIIDAYMRGFAIEVPNKDDALDMYNILEKYLKDQVHAVSYSLNAAMVKDDRLDDIEKFVAEMFSYNKDLVVQDAINKDKNFNLGINLGMNTINLINPLEITATEEDMYSPIPTGNDLYNNIVNNTQGVNNIHANVPVINIGEVNIDNVDLNKVKRISTYRNGMGRT